LYPSDALDHIAQRLISTQAVRDSKDRYPTALWLKDCFCATTAPISGSVLSTYAGVSLNPYVSNLSRQSAEDDLQEAFAAFRQVTWVTIIDEAERPVPNIRLWKE
jgi:hypothetical protein